MSAPCNPTQRGVALRIGGDFGTAHPGYPMTRDKQLSGIRIQAVRLKRDLDQALNMKEFAVLAGVSYSVAREWFRLPGFPAVLGKVFWGDFVLWRQTRSCIKTPPVSDCIEHGKTDQVEFRSNPPKSANQWPARAASILAEVFTEPASGP